MRTKTTVRSGRSGTVLQDAMNSGEVKDINGKVRRFVRYMRCEKIENNVMKRGNRSKMRRKTCIPITVFNERNLRGNIHISAGKVSSWPIENVLPRVLKGSRGRSLNRS